MEISTNGERVLPEKRHFFMKNGEGSCKNGGF
jgi:hypothetical protein